MDLNRSAPRLDDLLARLEVDEIERLSERLLGRVEAGEREFLVLSLESEIRSPKHIRDSVLNVQPPGFAILEELLESDGHRVDLHGLRERCEATTRNLATRVTAGEVISGGELARVYRSVLVEARRSDLTIDFSENALLTVLRHELGLRQVEHFLLEHHADLRPYWDEEAAFIRALNALRSSGLCFPIDGALVMPRELAPAIRLVLGLEMSHAARRRFFASLSVATLSDALSLVHLSAKGTSREEKVQRLIDCYVQPTDVVGILGVSELRDLCKGFGLNVGGLKEELANRLLRHFSTGRDLLGDFSPPSSMRPAKKERRELDDAAFTSLLSHLRMQDLFDILMSGIITNDALGSKQEAKFEIDKRGFSDFGSKEELISELLRLSFSERTQLSKLDLSQLDRALQRHDLVPGGSKSERINRLVDFHLTAKPPVADETEPSPIHH